MTADLDQLTTELAELRVLRDRLAAALTQGLAELRGTGAILSAQTLQAADEYRSRHADIERRIQSDADAEPLPQGHTLDNWEAVLERRKRRRQLDSLLGDIFRLEVRQSGSQGLLGPVQDEARILHERIEAGDDAAATEFLAGRHPLRSLLSLVQQGDQLSDAAWTDLQDQVGTRYGRELSTAISRGKVQFGTLAPNGKSNAAIEVLS